MYKISDFEALQAKFEQLINYYARRNGGEDMRAQLQMKLWELVQSNKAISQRYVAVALRNEYIRYSKELSLQTADGTPIEFIEACGTFEKIEESIEIRELLEKLSGLQKDVLILHRINGLSFAEIAARKDCTRQAVNNADKRGLDKLREMI